MAAVIQMALVQREVGGKGELAGKANVNASHGSDTNTVLHQTLTLVM
jgi:hypothetical protein